MSNVNETLKEKLTAESRDRLMAVDNTKIHKFVADAIELTNPEKVFVCMDSEEDVKHVREMAVKAREENAALAERVAALEAQIGGIWYEIPVGAAFPIADFDATPVRLNVAGAPNVSSRDFASGTKMSSNAVM